MAMQEAADIALEEPGAGPTFMSVVASMVFGTVVFLAMSVAPIMLGALVEAGRLTNETLGQVATLETLGIAAGSTFGFPLLRRGGLRAKVLVACVVLAALNIACNYAGGPAELMALRGIAGLIEGLVLAAAVLILTYARNPEAMSGYFLGITTIPQVIAAYVLTGVAIPRFGPNICFEAMAAVSLLGAVSALGASIRHVPTAEEHQAQGAIKWGPLAVIGLLAVLLQNAAIGGAFAYLVQMGKQIGVSEVLIGTSMAGLQATAVAGALLVGALAWRLSQRIILPIGCLVQAAVMVAIGHWEVAAVFVAVCCVFGLCWNALLPFSLKMLIELDPSRRLGLLNTPLSLAGLGIGPIIASLFVRGADVEPAFTAAATLFAAGAALYVLVNLLRPRTAMSAEA